MEKSLILFVLVLACSPLGLSVAVAEVPDFCQLFPSDGSGISCLMYLPQFFFNSTSQECEEFIYGGCGGNNNRFPSKKKCMETCKPRPTLFREMALTFDVEPCVSPRSHHRRENACNQPPEAGPCMAYMPQFFYNSTSGKCEIFIYGGCSGNRNRFDSRISCQMYCRAVPAFNATEVCNLAPETGVCRAAFPQLYYNPKSQRCEPFIYGGCGGNNNRFDSVKDCMKTCHAEGSDVITPLITKARIQPQGDPSACSLEPETGPCRAHIPSYFYNSTSHQCQKFTFGGCGGNDNRFVSRRECNLSCRRTAEQPTESPGAETTDTCLLPSDSGPCHASIPRFHYNHKTQKCEEFAYGGCKGNLNNFVDEDQCMKACKKN